MAAKQRRDKGASASADAGHRSARWAHVRGHTFCMIACCGLRDAAEAALVCKHARTHHEHRFLMSTHARMCTHAQHTHNTHTHIHIHTHSHSLTHTHIHTCTPQSRPTGHPQPYPRWRGQAPPRPPSPPPCLRLLSVKGGPLLFGPRPQHPPEAARQRPRQPHADTGRGGAGGVEEEPDAGGLQAALKPHCPACCALLA